MCENVCVKRRRTYCICACFLVSNVRTFACMCASRRVGGHVRLIAYVCEEEINVCCVPYVCFCIFLSISACVWTSVVPLSLTFSSHTQVCPSVYFTCNRREWQEVKQAMSTHLCLCDAMCCVLLIS